MRTALSDSVNKWFEHYIQLAKQHRLVPRKLHLIFDPYDKNEDYPKMRVETKDLDVLDAIWRTQATVVIQIWANNEESRHIKQTSNFLYDIIQKYGQNIPVFEHITVLDTALDTDEIKDLELGEKITGMSNNTSQLAHPRPDERLKPGTPFKTIEDESFVVYVYDRTLGEAEVEYVLGVDYTVDYDTGLITWLRPVDLDLLENEQKEIRVYYTYRQFQCFCKILEGSLLEIPLNMPQEQYPGILRTDISFDILY